MRYLKPIPEVTEFNRPFFEGLCDHRFVVPRCQACGSYNWVPYPACRTCLSLDVAWTAVSGNATLYTFTVVHRGPGAFAADVPYVVAMGELIEQPRTCLVIANLIGSPPESLRIGQALKIAFEDIPCEDMTTYHWTATGR